MSTTSTNRGRAGPPVTVCMKRDGQDQRRVMGSRIPERTACYRLFSVSKRLLYVGIGWNPAKRFGDHRRTKSWWAEVSYAEIRRYSDRPDAEDDESRAIRLESPAYNVQGRGGPWRLRETPDAPEPIGEVEIVRISHAFAVEGVRE